MALDPSEVTIRDQHNRRVWGIWQGLWFISWFGLLILFRLRRDLVPAGMLYWVVAALPLFVAAGALWFWARYLRQADELQRRIQLNALAFGFGVTFFWIGSYSVLVVAGAPPPKPGTLQPMAPGLCAYGLALLYGKWQYR
jgi:hypothetical protein